MRIVILGAGFAGLTLATELDDLAAAGKADVTLVERAERFAMGFNMQWALDGRRPSAEGYRPYTRLRAKHVRRLRAEATGIDPAARTVRTASETLPYDRLVLATGAETAPDLVPGWGDGVHDLYDADSVSAFRRAFDGIEKGIVGVVVWSVPFKCPPAPYEYALLLDDMLRARGAWEAGGVVLSTPEPRPMPVAGPAVGEAVTALLKERGIEYCPNRVPTAIDAARRTVAFRDGEALAYGVLGVVPPHRAPSVVREAGLADASGFVPSEFGTFRTAVPGVYAVGDVAALKLPTGSPHPKAGVFAEAQARTVAQALAAEIRGGTPPAYPGKGVCFVDAGRGEAAAARIELVREGGPLGHIEPPTADALEEKRAFERERFQTWFGG